VFSLNEVKSVNLIEKAWVAAFSAQPKGMANSLANHPFAPLRCAKGCHPFQAKHVRKLAYGCFHAQVLFTIRIISVWQLGNGRVTVPAGPQLRCLGSGTVVHRAKRRYKKYGAARCGLRRQTIFEGD